MEHADDIIEILRLRLYNERHKKYYVFRCVVLKEHKDLCYTKSVYVWYSGRYFSAASYLEHSVDFSDHYPVEVVLDVEMPE